MGHELVVPTAVVLVAALIAAVTDLWKFKVYNALTFPLLFGGLLYHGVTAGWSGLLGSVVGILFGFFILLIFYIMGGMGASDVKLMMALGAWLGFDLTFRVFVVSALLAGVYAVGLVVVSGRVAETWMNLQILWLRLSAVGRHLGFDDRIELEVNRADRRRRVIPFAALVAIGVIVTLASYWKLITLQM